MQETLAKAANATEVTRHNLTTLLPKIEAAIDESTFIAIDVEFTGLGDLKNTRLADLRERYTALSQTVNTHAIISVGLSTYVKIRNAAYTVKNLNFLMLNADSHTISPKSMSFLVDNGFDFNNQFRNGIPYVSGDDVPSCPPTSATAIMRSIFMRVARRGVPSVVHNGLLDLMFLYRSFHSSLPSELDTFVADITDLFVGGLYDTKYIADYITREKVSFLAFIFRKYEREQMNRRQRKKSPYLTIDINDIDGGENPPSLASPSFAALDAWRSKETKSKKRKVQNDNGKMYCEAYAYHGHCVNGRLCSKSHDLDYILDSMHAEETKRRKTETGEKDSVGISAFDGANLDDLAPRISTVKSGTTVLVETKPVDQLPGSIFETYHAASFDAFMTGFVFCRQWLHASAAGIEEHKNKIYLIGKATPLLLHKSQFTKLSANHQARILNWSVTRKCNN